MWLTDLPVAVVPLWQVVQVPGETLLWSKTAGVQAQGDYATLWADLKVKLAKAWSMDEGTVVMDTASEAHELSRLAAFGKLTQVMPHHYGPVNAEPILAEHILTENVLRILGGLST